MHCSQDQETEGLEEALEDTMKSLVVYHVSSCPLLHREGYVVASIFSSFCKMETSCLESLSLSSWNVLCLPYTY